MTGGPLHPDARDVVSYCIEPSRRRTVSLMRLEVEDLSDQRLAEWLMDADSSARADTWACLVEASGRHEASRRWLAAFAASDAAET
jgi:hypothetical protein